MRSHTRDAPLLFLPTLFAFSRITSDKHHHQVLGSTHIQAEGEPFFVILSNPSHRKHQWLMMATSNWQKDSSDQNFDYMFKILIIGNSSVGKTSFLFRYADDSFTSAFVSTVGIDFKVKTVLRQNKRVKLQIWVSNGVSVINRNTSRREMQRCESESWCHIKCLPIILWHILVSILSVLPCRTPQVRRDIVLSLRLIIEEQWVSSWCTTLRTRNLSAQFKTGWPKSKLTPGIMHRSYWLVTSVTVRRNVLSPQIGENNWLTSWD